VRLWKCSKNGISTTHGRASLSCVFLSMCVSNLVEIVILCKHFWNKKSSA
jgi:hypothetical protein